jgi:hypothetical protein
MKKPSDNWYIVIGIILLVVVCSIPFRQVVEMTKVEEYTSTDQYHIVIGFGGPKVTWVTVNCNRTAEIRFIYQVGAWLSIQDVLLASFRSTTARYYFNSEHSMNIVEVISDRPIIVRVVYTYLLETEMNLFSRFLYSIGLCK